MKQFYILFLCLGFNTYLFSQKQIKDYSLEELNLKKSEATAINDLNNAEVYDQAIKYKQEIEAAIKVEDYDKAAICQEKLSRLKPILSPAEKIKQLQEELNSAIAKEDYEKADQLKQEIEELKGNKPKSSSASLAAAGSAGSNSSSAKTNLTKNSIYGPNVIWMGLDFSLFSFVSSKKIGEEQEHKKNIPIWQREFHEQIGSEKLGKWLQKTSFTDDRSSVENLANSTLNRSWIVSQRTSLSKDKIQKHLSTYKSSKHGLALVFIPEVFDETEREISIWVVWFDNDSKAIVHTQAIVFTGVNAGTMTNKWGAALIDCTKTYVDKYYRKKL